jgi:hypothetical protein
MAVIEHGWSETWRLRGRELRDGHGLQDRAALEMHYVTKRLSELRDALQGCDYGSFEMNL